jgi:hypothetical protein
MTSGKFKRYALDLMPSSTLHYYTGKIYVSTLLIYIEMARFYPESFPTEKHSIVDRFEVKPNKRNVALFALSLSILTLIGLWLLVTGEDFVDGFFIAAISGGLGLYVIPKLLRRNISMVLTREGIEQITKNGTAIIFWNDIEQIGIVEYSPGIIWSKIFPIKMVGLRLSSYGNYLANMSPQLAESITKSLPYLKVKTKVASLEHYIDIEAKLWSKLTGQEDPHKMIMSLGRVGSLVDLLLWRRKTYGYDIMFAWSDIDRPAGEFVDLLEQYRKCVSIN